MVLLDIKYSMRGIMCDVITVCEPRSCECYMGQINKCKWCHCSFLYRKFF